FKDSCGAKWVQAGARKGGMTSVYHRRFYPNDVDGVVAYVAPNDRINPEDSAYARFFASMAGVSCGPPLGTADRSFEMTILDTEWAFFQYASAATNCADVPPVTATDSELFAFI